MASAADLARLPLSVVTDEDVARQAADDALDAAATARAQAAAEAARETCEREREEGGRHQQRESASSALSASSSSSATSPAVFQGFPLHKGDGGGGDSGGGKSAGRAGCAVCLEPWAVSCIFSFKINILRRCLYAALLACILRFLTCCPVPGPLAAFLFSLCLIFSPLSSSPSLRT